MQETNVKHTLLDTVRCRYIHLYVCLSVHTYAYIHIENTRKNHVHQPGGGSQSNASLHHSSGKSDKS